MVKTQTAVDEVQGVVDAPLGASDAIVDRRRWHVVKVQEPCFTRYDGVHVPEQPVEIEVVTALSPPLENRLHALAAFRPGTADLGKGQVTVGKFGAAAVDAIEDVHHHIDRLVGTGHFLHVELDVPDAQDLVQATVELPVPGLELRDLSEAIELFAQSVVSPLHQLGDIDPEGVVLHTRGLVEPELLLLEMEVEPCKGPGIAVEERGRFATDDPVERCHPLLAVQEQPHDTRRKILFSPVIHVLRRCRPYKQAPNRMAAVQ